MKIPKLNIQNFYKPVMIILALLVSFSSYSQDSLKIKWPGKDTASHRDSLKLQPMNFFNVRPLYHFFDLSLPDTISRNRFLWYPLKGSEEILNYLTGYYFGYMDIGQRGYVSYNRMDAMYTGMFRNERPLNDLIDGSIDFNLLSRNEILEIERTYGNNPYNFQNGINIIQRQVAQNKPYSEIAFWQDRYENLNLDANFQQNIYRKLNFNFGITKHSYDGKYSNSDFDKWLGRFNFNFAFSNKVNGFIYTNYSHIQRGLNSGIDPSLIDINNKSSVFDASLASVRNSDAYEIKERFDVDAGATVLTSKDSLSYFRFQAFTSNNVRKYRDEENRVPSNGVFLTDNSHWIDYGIKLHNLYHFRAGRNAQITSSTDAEYDYDVIDYRYANLINSQRVFLYQDFYLRYSGIGVNAYAKAYQFKYFQNKFFGDWGVKPSYTFNFKDTSSVRLFASYEQSQKLPTYQQYFLEQYFHPVRTGYNYPGYESVSAATAGAELRYKSIDIFAEYFNNKSKNYLLATSIAGNTNLPVPQDLAHNGFNVKLTARLMNFDLDGTFQLAPKSLTNSAYDSLYPEYTGNVNLAYHNIFFKNKLEVKIGINTRFWTSYYANNYYGYFNMFTNRLSDSVTNSYSNVKLSPNATLDFYVIAKINKAIFGLTFENILNRLVYTEGLYPYMDRGGFINVISRFNITWYFLN